MDTGAIFQGYPAEAAPVSIQTSGSLAGLEHKTRTGRFLLSA
jgi:hypothetical protein